MRVKDYIPVAFVITVTVVAGFYILSVEPRSSASIHHDHGTDSHAKAGDAKRGDDTDTHVRDEHGHDHDADKHEGSEHGEVSHGTATHKEHGHEADSHPGHQDHDIAQKGPHGGRLFREGCFGVEVSIVEKGMPPMFRVYGYEDGKPVDPKDVQVSMEVKRLGGRVSEYRFQPKGDFLHCDTVIEEPHSFDVNVAAVHEGKTYHWEFSQVEARVELVPRVAKTVGIEVETAGPTHIRSVLELPGEVALNADMVCHVVPRVSGVVAEARKNLGDFVQAGEVVAVLESRELADARSRYLVYMTREELAFTNFRRIKNLWENKVTPEKEYLDSQKAYQEAKIERLASAQKLRALGLSGEELKALSHDSDKSMIAYELKAPFDGVVITKHISKGEFVQDNADVLCIADLSTVWVDIIVYADNLDAVHVGQRATVRVDANHLTAVGTVSYVGPVVGEKSRTARARVVLDNSHGKWRPGMFVTVRLIKEEASVPVAVKRGAVQKLDQFGDSVFVRYGDFFEVRPVELGRGDSTNVEVLKGLSPGEKYASARSFVIKSELGKGGLSHSH